VSLAVEAVLVLIFRSDTWWR